jgi:hypothetical protein
MSRVAGEPRCLADRVGRAEQRTHVGGDLLL